MANSVTVGSVQDSVTTTLTELAEQSATYADEVMAFVKGLPPAMNQPLVYLVLPDANKALTTIQNQIALKPSLSMTSLNAREVSEVADYALEDVETPEFETIPEMLGVDVPVVVIPEAPDTTLPTSPGEAPEPDMPDLPDEPVIVLPPVPVFEAIVVPPTPACSIPSYTPTAVEDDMLSPTSTFAYVEEEYQSALLDAVKAKLINDILNGGYGIETADELALWQRARERELLNTETILQDVMRQAAARGFAYPPGAFQAVIDAARDEALAKNSSLSRDIALKRGDLYVQNRQFALTTAKEVEQMLLTHFGYIRERALNVAKYTADFGVQIFNAVVARFNARLEASKTSAAVYETQLKAALAGLEAFKIEVEGKRLVADVYKLGADVYNTQLRGVEATVNIYRAQMDATRVAADIEKLKLDAFRTQVDTYIAQVGAKSAEFDMFKAVIGGELAKVDVYKAQVSAYSELVQTYSAKAQVVKLETDVELDVQRLTLEKYKTDLAAYEVKMNNARDELRVKLEKFGLDSTIFQSVLNATANAMRTVADVNKSNADVLLSKAQLDISHIHAVGALDERRQEVAVGVSGAMLKSIAEQAMAIGGQLSGIVAEIQSSEAE